MPTPVNSLSLPLTPAHSIALAAALLPATPLEWLCVPLWPLAVAVVLTVEIAARVSRPHRLPSRL